jgi:hypothetical protein
MACEVCCLARSHLLARFFSFFLIRAVFFVDKVPLRSGAGSFSYVSVGRPILVLFFLARHRTLS